MRPWYFRWWGIAVILYVVLTGALGLIYFVSMRRLDSGAATSAATLRTGGFTDSSAATVPSTTDLKAAPIMTDADPTVGATAADAGLVIVEFSDFECQFCRQAFPIIRSVVASHADRVRYVYRDFPVDSIHSTARDAAEAAQCAHEQGKFWSYHDKLFQSADTLDANLLAQLARQVGLDGQQFDACVASRRFADEVQRDVDAGITLGVRGTPTWFFLPDGDTAKARRVEGVIPMEALERAIERVLTK
ncbi:MAG: DsbA family protein [Candidatus Uhrbacteria bacterium]